MTVLLEENYDSVLLENSSLRGQRHSLRRGTLVARAEREVLPPRPEHGRIPSRDKRLLIEISPGKVCTVAAAQILDLDSPSGLPLCPEPCARHPEPKFIGPRQG